MSTLYEKYKKTKNKYIYEIILQWYLIKKKYRNTAYISGYLLNKDKLDILINFMNKNSISYKILQEKGFSFIIYNPGKIDTQVLSNMTNKEIGKLLGNFYTCASNKYGAKGEHRIVIKFNDVEVYAQMCKKIKNFNHIYNIYLEVFNIFNKLDKKIFGKSELSSNSYKC